MARRLTPDDFNHLFRYFHQDAFRLEVQPVYEVDVEREAFDDYLRGEPRPAYEYGYYAPWLDQIRELTQAGRRVARVRVLEEPPTSYQAFELAMAPYNIEAGESLRTMARSTAVRVGVPLSHDWWLFDSSQLALMRFDRDGTPGGGEIIDDPEIVAHYCMWRDLAVRHSTPFLGRAAA